jgi:hypothetical protein
MTTVLIMLVLSVCASAFSRGAALRVLPAFKQLQLHMQQAAASTASTVKDTSPKKIIVLGGDGFCGWPTSLYLSDMGHDVVVVDNLSRRKIDVELGCQSLTPIAQIEERVSTWNGLQGAANRQPITFRCIVPPALFYCTPSEANLNNPTATTQVPGRERGLR